MGKPVSFHGLPGTAKGRTTMPKPVCNDLGLRFVDRMAFEVDADGGVVLRKTSTEAEAAVDRFAHLAGCATAGFSTDEVMAVTRGED